MINLPTKSALQLKSVSHNDLIKLEKQWLKDGEDKDRQSRPSNRHSESFSGEKIVLAERVICYCSNFDLNFNEWFQMHENMLLLYRNLLKNLGKKILNKLIVILNLHFYR